MNSVRHERLLPHPIERVWRAITEPDELRTWSPGIPDWRLEAGERFEVEGSGGGSGEIVELDPASPARVRLGATSTSATSSRPKAKSASCASRTSSTTAAPARSTRPGGTCATTARTQSTPLSASDSLERRPQVHERRAQHLGSIPRSAVGCTRSTCGDESPRCGRS